MAIKTPITIAYGDGIGPEIMEATLAILRAANANIKEEVIEIGKKAYLEGYTSGIPDFAWKSLKRTKVLLKSPITTPQGGGYKSLNVTLRKTLGLYANVRPCLSYYPYVPAKVPGIDMIIVRENEEDLYAGIEYRQTEDVYQAIKIVTKPGCENIIHYAFEYARKFNRKKVTCFTKDNIMKMTDGLFHQIFNDISKQYPDISHEHYIIDIGTALLATHPEHFDVIVTLNLYGDIISDVAAQVAGSVGLAGSANVGAHMAMFEAIHGSAPDIAGKNIANPSGLLNAAIQMLVHINQPEIASLIENAWLRTIEDGIHTRDIYSEEYSKEKVGTKEFAQNVIDRLGMQPQFFKAANYQSGSYAKIACYGETEMAISEKVLVGTDISIDNQTDIKAEELAAKIETLHSKLKLTVITSKGLKIWPNCSIETPYLQQCCMRFQADYDFNKLDPITHHDINDLLFQLDKLGFDVIRVENLYTFSGKPGFSLAQGQ